VIHVLERSPQERCEATWWRQATEGGAYWRCYLPAKHLPGQCLDLSEDLDLAEGADGVPYMPRMRGRASIWQFPGEHIRAQLAAQQQEWGVRVLLECDDNYLIPAPPVPGVEPGPWKPTVREANGGYSHEAHRRIASWVDGVIVSTPFLEKQYRKVNDHVYVCPNSVDPDDWDDRKADDGVLRIGYAASDSHRVDVAVIERAFRWASKQDGVQVFFLGVSPPNVEFRRVEVGWAQSLPEYRRLLQALDVGCCPLIENHWSAARSDVKALEYAMAGALPIVSRTEPYREWWDGPAPVATTPAEFYKTVRWCVQNRDEVKRLAREAKEYVLKNRTIQQAIWRWEEAINEES